MRKLTLAVIMGAFMMSANTASAQTMSEGNVAIDLYYGFPNLYTSALRTAYANSGSEENIKVGGIGPLGLRVEYMLADKVGLGADFGFNNSSVTYDYESSVWNPATSTYDPITYTDEIKTTKIGFMVVFNYHFIDNDNLDFFGTVGAGYKNRSFNFSSTNPSFDDSGSGTATLIPIAARVGLGMRYFFTDNIGINLGVGFGQGGIANGGLSVKF